MSASKERWNEQEAILLLQGAAKLVQEIETSGTRMPHSEREQYHARLVAAHDARDMWWALRASSPPWDCGCSNHGATGLPSLFVYLTSCLDYLGCFLHQEPH